MDINLLPWRDQRSSKQKKILCLFFISTIIFSVLCSLGLKYYIIQLQNQQIKKIIILQDKIYFISKKLEKYNQAIVRNHANQGKEQFINQAIKNNQTMIEFFMKLGQTIPDTISLFAITRQADGFLLFGFSPSHTELNLLLDRLADATDNNKILLTETHLKQNDPNTLEFQLKFLQPLSYNFSRQLTSTWK